MVKQKAAAKKTAAKKAPARAAKKNSAADRKVKNGAPRSMRGAAKTAKPRSGEQLELIKGVRYTDLDRLCRQIGDNRDDLNELKSSGTDLELAALKAMRLHGVTGYKNAGVLITIVPGDEKLSVKKDRVGASSDGGGSLNQPDVGEGQDPANIAESLTDSGDDDQPED